MGAIRTVEFNLGDKLEVTDLIIAGIYAKLNEFMGMTGPGGFGYGGAQFAQPGYGPAQGTYANPNEPQQNNTQRNASQPGWN